MEGANFHGANFKYARLNDAVVSGADFTGAIVDSAERVLKGATATTPPIGVKVGGNNGD